MAFPGTIRYCTTTFSKPVLHTGTALDEIGKADTALGKYSEAIKADPKSALAHYAHGVLLATRQRTCARTIGDFDKAPVLEPPTTTPSCAAARLLNSATSAMRSLTSTARS